MRKLLVYLFMIESMFSIGQEEIEYYYDSELLTWKEVFKDDFIKVVDRNMILNISDKYGLDSAITFIYFFGIPPEIDHELFNSLFSMACPELKSKNLYHYVVAGYALNDIDPPSGEELGLLQEGDTKFIDIESFNTLINKDQAYISRILDIGKGDQCTSFYFLYVNDKIAYSYSHDVCIENEEGYSIGHTYEIGLCMEIKDNSLLEYFRFSTN